MKKITLGYLRKWPGWQDLDNDNNLPDSTEFLVTDSGDVVYPESYEEYCWAVPSVNWFRFIFDEPSLVFTIRGDIQFPDNHIIYNPFSLFPKLEGVWLASCNFPNKIIALDSDMGDFNMIGYNSMKNPIITGQHNWICAYEGSQFIDSDDNVWTVENGKWTK